MRRQTCLFEAAGSRFVDVGPQGLSQSVCAVIVTFNPGRQLAGNIAAVLAQVGQVVVVDNASSIPASQKMLHDLFKTKAIMLLRSPENEGIGAALNHGFQLAGSLGYQFALALDQDSQPLTGMVQTLLGIYQTHSQRHRIAIVAPNFHDPDSGTYARYLRPWARVLFKRLRCEGDRIDDVTIAISSGALFRLSCFQQLGGFREDLFIDYVDTEYCLRARTRGYEIAVACGASLRHKWGEVRTKRLGPATVRPTFHTPQRWYYIARNRILVLRIYAAKVPHWLIYDTTLGIWWLLRMLLFEDQRKMKLKALLLGTFDGLRGRSGRGRTII